LKQWIIADSLESQSNSSINVYGWDYSDSNTYWPKDATLFMHEYPQLLSVIPKNDSVNISKEEEKYLGLYEKDPIFTSQGYPVWTHSYSRSAIGNFRYPDYKPNWSILDLSADQNQVKLFQRDCVHICPDGWIKSLSRFQNSTDSNIKVVGRQVVNPKM